MSHRSSALALLAALGSSTLAAPTQAQCAHWSPGFASPSASTDSFDLGFTLFDDGSGTKPYVGAQGGVRRWTGARWEPVFEFGLAPTARQLVATEESGAPILLVMERTSSFGSRLWRWDGGTASIVASVGIATFDVERLDDGSGSAIYVVGQQSNLIGRVMRLAGGVFVDVGAPFSQAIRSITVSSVSGTPRLYVGGGANAYGPSSVAMWDGTMWVAVPGINTATTSLASFDDGTGEKLYAGLQNDNTGNALRSFDGTNWSTIGALDSVQDIERAALPAQCLLVAGQKNATSPPQGVHVFDGTTLAPATSSIGTAVKNVAAWFDGTEAHVFASDGAFTTSTLDYDDLAEWTPSEGWRTFGRGFYSRRFDRCEVRAFAPFDFGSGPQLAAFGFFDSAGHGDDIAMNGFSRWDGTNWRSLGTGGKLVVQQKQLDLPRAAEVVDFGAGPELYVGGAWLLDFQGRGFMRWTGTTWTRPIPNDFGHVFALRTLHEIHDTKLFVGGQFPGPGTPGENVFAWDGTTTLTLGAGLDGPVSALAPHDEGAGERMFAGGEFTHSGAADVKRVARWDGTAWTALGGGIDDGGVFALCSFQGSLYAGGAFDTIGGVPMASIARWNGSTWSTLPGGGAFVTAPVGQNGTVFAMCVHDDGRGPALYVAGGFTRIGGIDAVNIARFDGASWEAVDGGLDKQVYALTSFDDDGDGDEELFAGGAFSSSPTRATGRVARLEGCPHHASFCSGDGALTDHTTPCPCGNSGAAGHGCANSFEADGASLTASGSTQHDDIVLDAAQMPPVSVGIYLQQDAAGDHVFHDGVSCAGGSLLRIRTRNANTGASRFPDPAFAQDATITLSQRGGVTPGSGVTRYYSTFYRNASTSFCPPATANVSNGVRIVW